MKSNKFDQAAFEELHGAGCEAVACTQEPGDVFFILAGWLCVERVLRGMLVYGARQAVFLKGLGGCSELCGAHGLLSRQLQGWCCAAEDGRGLGLRQ